MSKIAINTTNKEVISVSAKKAIPLAIKQATGASGGGNINITPYITMDGSYVVFNYFTPKQMAEVYILLEGGNLWFELTKDEEGQYSLTTKCDIQELDGMFIVGGEEFIVNTIVDSFIVDLKEHKVSEVRIEGIDADLLDADFTWKLAEIGNKLDNIKLPEIDTTELAKQGDNPNATLTAIYKLLIGSNEPSQDIPEGVAERLALILEFFGMKPIESYEFMTPEEVCAELEEIMTSMDLDLTPEKAKEITQQTLNN